MGYTLINNPVVDGISFVHLLQDARFCGEYQEGKFVLIMREREMYLGKKGSNPTDVASCQLYFLGGVVDPSGFTGVQEWHTRKNRRCETSCAR